MNAAKRVGVGLIGAGLMGRELTSAIGRWSALQHHPVTPVLRAVCDTNADALAWFDRVESVRHRTTDYRELLDDADVDVLYIAVPHHLHEAIYLDAATAGKDFLGEKPFGLDLAAASKIQGALTQNQDVFVRCSSEMPFFPGAQFAFKFVAAGGIGQPIEARSAFLHSSDLNRAKPVNWKRQAMFCGPTGVMADLGMHVTHVPLRLGWMPARLYAVLQDIVSERPGPDGSLVPCDTIENATQLWTVESDGADFPVTVETKRIAPGEMNTWTFRAVGMDGGIEFSTRYPQTVRRFGVRDGAQVWEELQVGSQSAFPSVTGGIFEFGFADAVQQMWAAYLAEREGELGEAFGCATPDEAVATHRIMEAALASADTRAAVAI